MIQRDRSESTAQSIAEKDQVTWFSTCHGGIYETCTQQLCKIKSYFFHITYLVIGHVFVISPNYNSVLR